jgi:hypothetical protein
MVPRGTTRSKKLRGAVRTRTSGRTARYEPGAARRVAKSLLRQVVVDHERVEPQSGGAPAHDRLEDTPDGCDRVAALGAASEVDVAVHALNRMLELGRPESVRIA